MKVLPDYLTNELIHAVVHGEHGDIFSVLGIHQHSNGTFFISCMQPGAVKVEVIDFYSGDIIQELAHYHPLGFFSSELSGVTERFLYRLKVTYPEGEHHVTDPYQFGSLLDEQDVYLFSEGSQERAYEFLGAHIKQVGDVTGILFAVWAPNAHRVSVVGDFNHWNGAQHVMRKHLASGIWEIFIADAIPGQNYKYEIQPANGRQTFTKADPYASSMQHPPQTASVISATTAHQWQDNEWMAKRDIHNRHDQPVSIYEVHLGSWKRKDGNYLSYRELADELIPYTKELGFTHLQLMPVSEFPFDGSWGYQPVGLFAPSSRFGSPDDFRYFVDCCHKANLGLLLDWVPGHFPTDAYGLAEFDGTHLYEHADPRQGYHPDWNTLIYNYARGEVGSFLISNAIYWMGEFHIDGLRVDAVASMLYLDYSREHDQWVPNAHGGRENLDAIEFLRQTNKRVYKNYPGSMMVAEESTDWPSVTGYADHGGLGFGYKWNMGWMNDTLRYMARDPIYRKFHHNDMTFGLVYAFSENFVLPLSHDEVVHGKGSLLEKMPGDDWQKFANLRAYFGFGWTHPGKKLLFMGGEFAQRREWNHDASLDWHLLDSEWHRGVQQLIKDLNHCYKNEVALHELDCDHNGFEWIDGDNRDQSIFVYMRKAKDSADHVIVIANMTPATHHQFRIGVNAPSEYQELINTDESKYGGSGVTNAAVIKSSNEPWQGRDYSVEVTVPPLATLVLKPIVKNDLAQGLTDENSISR